jgi:hypothetical protein
MARDENLQELFRRWTPVTLINLPEEIQTPEIFPDYMGPEKDPAPVGHVKGLLTVLGYSHDLKRPYVVKCVCGNLLKASVQQVSLQYKMAQYLSQDTLCCGCFCQITRTAYLIRLRVEALRSWCQQMGSWLDDLNTLRRYARKYKVEISKNVEHRKPLRQIVRMEYEDDPLTFDRRVEPKMIDDQDMFMKLIAPSPEYEKFLREMADKLAHEYEPWAAIPMASLSAYASYKRELPEFDAATFINFVNYLIDMEQNSSKVASSDGEENQKDRESKKER